jgi:DNA-binding transcriptional LysR family regulator
VLRLFTGWSNDLVQRVRAGALDAAVVLLPDGEGLPGGMDGNVLASEQLLVIAPRQGQRNSLTLREASEAGWILNPEGCAARAWLQRLLAKGGMPLRVAVEAYNYDLQISLVARARGLGLVPTRLLARSPARKRVSELRVRGLEFPMKIWVITGSLASGLEQPVATLSAALKRRLARPRTA